MNDLVTQFMGSRDEFLAFARARLGDPELAADAVQESLLKALLKVGQLRRAEGAKAWFYRILRRTIIDLYRRRGAQERLRDQWQHEAAAGPDSAAERVVCACLKRLLPTLKLEYATLLRRLDLAEEDPKTVAASLGISANTLAVRRHRARQELRRQLEATCRACAQRGCQDCGCDEN